MILDTVWVIQNRNTGAILYGVGRTKACAWRNALKVLFDADPDVDAGEFRAHQRSLQNEGWKGVRVNIVAMPENQ